jgi:NAD(P)-dependent dehydrogenase (short-subunit alcohol dehydrogenase family)
MRVLITGASSGIGAELARRLARRGDDLVLVARGREGLEATARAVRELGCTAVIAPADVTDAEAIAAAVDRGARELGGLDAVVCNAGGAAYGLTMEMDAADIEQTIRVTLLGHINTARAAIGHLERTGGVLVATGSVAGKHPLPLMTPYTAAKHGVRGFMNALGLELRATGSRVRVAVVHPGPVDTPFWVHVTPSGVMPPKIPPLLAYDPAKVARTIQHAIDKPSPERVSGAVMRVMDVLPRAVRDLVLTQCVRYALRHPGDDPPGQAIWAASGDGQRRALASR